MIGSFVVKPEWLDGILDYEIKFAVEDDMSKVAKKRISEFMSGTAGSVGGSTEQPMMIEKPLIIMFGQDDKLVCHIHPREKDTYEGYGLMICDLVRHIANAFKVDEEDVWEWVDKERHHHTTDITQPS